MAYERELAVAMNACLAAARLCERVRRDIPQAMEKPDRSPVTVSGAQVR